MTAAAVPEPLRQRYLGSFAEKRAALEAGLDLLSADALGGMSALRGAAHKISGSAGMYEFEDIGQLARDIVHTIDAAGEAAVVCAQVQQLIDALTAASAS